MVLGDLEYNTLTGTTKKSQLAAMYYLAKKKPKIYHIKTHGFMWRLYEWAKQINDQGGNYNWWNDLHTVELTKDDNHHHQLSRMAERKRQGGTARPPYMCPGCRRLRRLETTEASQV